MSAAAAAHSCETQDSLEVLGNKFLHQELYSHRPKTLR